MMGMKSLHSQHIVLISFVVHAEIDLSEVHVTPGKCLDILLVEDT